MPTSSATPFDADLFAVGFDSPGHGFAGGSVCGDSAHAFEALDACPAARRVPVLYEYSEPPGQPGQWMTVSLPGADRQGFVGAIKWLGEGRALAVGGDGCYPRRESDVCASAPGGDAAGRARAWLYERGSWRELDLKAQLAQGMGGLTALGCSPRAEEFCVAGAYQQLWMWRDGRFTSGYGPHLNPDQLDDPGRDPTLNPTGDFRFRVRDVKFFPGHDTPQIQVAAVTSGCCAYVDPSGTVPDPTGDIPRVLLYDGTKWYVRPLYSQTGSTNGQHAPQTLPDSLYALTTSPIDAGGKQTLSALATPGGTVSSNEPVSRIIGDVTVLNPKNFQAPTTEPFALAIAEPFAALTGPASNATDLPTEARNPSTAHLHMASGDGDLSSPPYSVRANGNYTPGGPDGVMDWAVGELTDTTAPGQAAAMTTTLQPYGVSPPSPLTCPLTSPDVTCKPQSDPTQITKQTQSMSVFKLPSYRLNSFSLLTPSGIGWAVGDKGAILRLGGTGLVGQNLPEPAPPALASGTAGVPADDSSYDAFRPLARGPAGSVPALGNQPLDRLAAPRMIPVGSPNPTKPSGEREENVSSIVMSRDGSEGWAIGAGYGAANSTTTLYHYFGGRWTRCAPDGIPGVVPADAACASLAKLRVGTSPVLLITAARVPHEYADPAHADEFEVIAIGSRYTDERGRARGTVVRYRQGRWSLDEAAMNGPLGDINTEGFDLADVAFTAPDDGWILKGAQGTLGGEYVWHYDGSQWTDCALPSNLAKCGDDPSSPRLPENGGTARLAMVDRRIYLYGTRTAPGSTSPMIIYRDPGGRWTAADGGYDPGFGAAGNTGESGCVQSFSVVRGQDGRYSGWAYGRFGDSCAQSTTAPGLLGQTAPMMRLEAGKPWQRWTVRDALTDYPNPPRVSHSSVPPPRLLTLDDPVHPGAAIFEPFADTFGNGPPLTFNVAHQRWEVLGAPFATAGGDQYEQALQPPLAGDGHSGAWVAARPVTCATGASSCTYFYHYTDRAPREVLTDVAHPIRETVTAASEGPDGSFWAATRAGVVYRYDRVTGWARLPISGWDPGSVVTNPSPAYAIAAGSSGATLVVGKRGRIADLSSGGAVLDPAAGASCAASGGQPPCGTGYDLHSVAVAPDRSALAGGDQRTVLYRPAGGAFAAAAKPAAAVSATISAIAMPAPGHAWLATSSGEIYAGQLKGTAWDWRVESLGAAGKPITLGPDGNAQALHAIAVDANGSGVAVGDRGLVLQRAAGGGWSRVASGVLENLRSVALAVGGGPGVLVGGDGGLVLTLRDGRLEVVRPPDLFDPVTHSRSRDQQGAAVGLGLAPGGTPGSVEAWAVLQVPVDPAWNRSPEPTALLHYASSPTDPLSTPVGRVQPLADTPGSRRGEISLAAYGKSDCSASSRSGFEGTGAVVGQCREPTGSNLVNEAISRRITHELLTRSRRPGGPLLSLSTGDISTDPGARPENGDLPTDPSRTHDRWAELVAGPMLDGGLPLFGALGGQDLLGSIGHGNPGVSLPWQLALGGMPSPWGAGPEARSGGVSFVAVGGTNTGPKARTHYAVDVQRGGDTVARLIVLDTSLRSLSAGESQQNPAESQTAWLQGVLASTPTGAQKVVLSEAPAYSYGPGASTDTQTDAAALESLLFQYKANLVVSGRLGWNGLYWATAPGLHSPCAGDDYPDPSKVPAAGSAPACGSTGGASGAATAGAPAPPAPPAQAGDLANTLTSTAAPAPAAGCSGTGENQAGVLPTVVASTAGGAFGPDGQSSGSADKQGYWHGYTIVRLDKTGDPRCTIVEQRPVFDWVGISAQTHVLRPGQHETLKGYGREPVGMDAPISYDPINGPAITHRYDLLKADPARPYLPDTTCPKTTDNPAGYCELSDPGVGQIDPVNGKVSTGKGNHPRVYAIGLLSVGDKAASWPLVFEPRRSYTPIAPARVVTPAPSMVPQVHVAAIAATSPPPPPSAPPPAPPVVGTPTLPQLPGLPGLPPLNSPPPASPPPPTGAPPPAPPASQAPSALSISVSPQSVGFAPPSGVVPPPAPPINPAPPGGARREAKAKQPAAAKSEESGAESETQRAGGDLAQGPSSPDQAMTRRDRVKLAPSFTFLTAHRQPSAWSRDALYGGGLLVMAAILALGYTTVRPTPRRRSGPGIAAPAWARRDRSGG
ncbi:MAG TPA: hypothetical protein VGN69_08545 [Solirubrobacteraceae bacterium]|nr:hypothetical protein [Solirubrobacteraceae bacterium]